MDVNQSHTNMSSSNPPPTPPSRSISKVQSTMTDRRPAHITETKARKKCHGNKKLQRFRKRRRARGMSEAAINKTIEARKREKDKQEAKKQQRTTTSTTMQPMETTISTTTTDVISVSLLECYQC
jgi:hypothetical protein